MSCLGAPLHNTEHCCILIQCSKWKISRNGTLVKILEHSEEKIMFSSYNQSRRNGTLIPLHLTNRNGVPVRSGPLRALIMLCFTMNIINFDMHTLDISYVITPVLWPK